MVGIREFIKDALLPPLMFPDSVHKWNEVPLSRRINVSPEGKTQKSRGKQKELREFLSIPDNPCGGTTWSNPRACGFSAGPLPRGDSHSANASSMCLARGVHRANLTSLVQNHDQDANFLCGAYD